MQISGIVKNSTIDFPGNLAAVLFTPYCNYDCYFCHNQDNIKNPTMLNMDKIMLFLNSRKGLLDGIVISGGEPLIHDDIVEFIEIIKNKGYKIKLDTNGSHPERLIRLIKKKLVDYVAIDYKCPLDEYVKICKATKNGVRESITMLDESNIDYEIRTTVIPELTEEKMIYMAKDFFPFKKYFLQVCNFENKKTDIKYLKTIKSKIIKYQPNVSVRKI